MGVSLPAGCYPPVRILMRCGLAAYGVGTQAKFEMH